jgi:hypothetical protein
LNTVPEQLTLSPRHPVLQAVEHKKFVRQFVRDRRTAAVHEAGHVVIAKMLRVPAWAYICFNPETDFDFRTERIWYGRTFCFGDTATEDQLRMIGVAGAVAELSWLREPVDEFFAEKMSEGDCLTAQCDPDDPDDKCMEAVDAVAKILQRGTHQWHDLLTETRQLIVASQPILRAKSGGALISNCSE